jgi:hypothetical protein
MESSERTKLMRERIKETGIASLAVDPMYGSLFGGPIPDPTYWGISDNPSPTCRNYENIVTFLNEACSEKERERSVKNFWRYGHGQIKIGPRSKTPINLNGLCDILEIKKLAVYEGYSWGSPRRKVNADEIPVHLLQDVPEGVEVL